jgi:hypothetical protein|tara:strand:- start:159 stop:1505 length:1347 start_codon:yes stop_codon:yes gene_type:complete
MAHQLTGKSIASTFEQLWYRATTEPGATTNAVQVLASENDQTDDIGTALYIGTARVGISEASPAAALSVGTGSDTLVAAPTDSEDVSILGINLVIDDSADYCMGIQNTSSSGNGLLIKAGDHATTDWALRVVDYNGGTEGLCVTGGGRVGIGTFAPEAQLHVYGGDSGQTVHSQADSFIIESKSDPMGMSFLSDDGEQVNIYFGDTSDNDVGKIIYDHADDSLAFWTNQAERVVILSSGRFGIGTTTPDLMLNVEDTQASASVVVLTNLSTEDTADVLILKTAHATNPTTDNVYIGFQDAGGGIDTVRGDGSGGIETTMTIASDSRIKKDVVDLTGGLDKINALRPVSFNYTDEYLNHKLQSVTSKGWWKDVQSGFIAQEFEQCFPVNVRSSKERVQGDNVSYDGQVYNDQDQIIVKKIDLSRDQIVFSYLVKAIQELSAKVTALENA